MCIETYLLLIARYYASNYYRYEDDGGLLGLTFPAELDALSWFVNASDARRAALARNGSCDRRFLDGREAPWRRICRAEGINYIMVNGEVTLIGGLCTGATPGSVALPKQNFIVSILKQELPHGVAARDLKMTMSMWSIALD